MRQELKIFTKLTALAAGLYLLAGQIAPSGHAVLVATAASPASDQPALVGKVRDRDVTPAILSKELPRRDIWIARADRSGASLEPVRIEVSEWNLAFRKASTARRKSQTWAEVSGSVVNLRSSPDLRASRIGRLTRGTRLEVLARKEKWARVRNPETRETGWMHADYLHSVERGPASS